MAVGPPLREPPSRGRIWLRRVVAVGVLLLLLGAAAALVVTIRGGKQAAPPPTTTAPPPPKPLRIVFPEGFTIDQMAARITAVNRIAAKRRNVRPRLSAVRYERLTRDARFPAGFGGKRGRLEGFLFPATYDFTKRTTTKQLVKAQLAAFAKNWKGVDLSYARSKKLTPYDVLIIASMVEREAAVASERPLVASVIYNRLKAGMPLGIDATIRYGLKIPGTESLHESQLAADTPYNTRLHAGLPPTPIGNPGLASIRAAAHPRKTDYLFFVRKPNSIRHFFTASESEFYKKQCEYGFGCG